MLEKGVLQATGMIFQTSLVVSSYCEGDWRLEAIH